MLSRTRQQQHASGTTTRIRRTEMAMGLLLWYLDQVTGRCGWSIPIMSVPAPFSQCRYKCVPRGGENNTHTNLGNRTRIKDEDDTKDAGQIMGGAVDDWMKSFEEQVQSLRLEMEAEAKREMEDLRREYYKNIESTTTTTTTIIPPKPDTIRPTTTTRIMEDDEDPTSMLGGSTTNEVVLPEEQGPRQQQQHDNEDATMEQDSSSVGNVNSGLKDVDGDKKRPDQEVTNKNTTMEECISVANDDDDDDPTKESFIMFHNKEHQQRGGALREAQEVVEPPMLGGSSSMEHTSTDRLRTAVDVVDDLFYTVLGGEERDLEETMGSKMTLTNVLSDNDSQQHVHEDNPVEPPMNKESLSSNSSKRKEDKIQVVDPPLNIDGLAQSIRHRASKKGDRRGRGRGRRLPMIVCSGDWRAAFARPHDDRVPPPLN
mmetsp:Transcript_14216/g.25784  ORF Transcript_14216/g.25784 Transcript_14216/m.25784 type:complete len:428 (-) Transcript_14216:539-1822(-)